MDDFRHIAGAAEASLRRPERRRAPETKTAPARRRGPLVITDSLAYFALAGAPGGTGKPRSRMSAAICASRPRKAR